jgi:ABC-2 type transport system ATP-binding protein
MPIVEVSRISKSFEPVKAVDNVSFSVEEGEIFALLGPNGAGKTTTIRIMLDIYRPDQGNVAIFGGPMNEAKKDRIGYMPEERGLYQDLPLESVLVYLASLKGISADQARRRASGYLERFDLDAYKHKKVKELSKGMQQKAQIIATLLHQPNLVIIDEPFSGLDPVNTQVVKDLLLELHRQNVTIIMSTHQMHQVEELSDRILLINHGKVMLYGELEQIRHQYAGNAVLVRTEQPLPVDLPGILDVASHNSASRLTLSPGVSPQDLLRKLVELNIPLEQFEIAVPTLDEIFIRVVKGEGPQV